MRLVKSRGERKECRCGRDIWRGDDYYPQRRGKALCFECGYTSKRVDDIVLSENKKLLAFIGLVLCIIFLLLGVNDG